MGKNLVTIRRLEISDKEAMAKLANNRKVFINVRDAFPHPYTAKDSEAFINNLENDKKNHVFAIEYDGQYAGNIGLFKQSDVYRKSAEIGYFIGEPFWNKGITTRAVNLATDYAFEHLNVIRIHCGVFDFNYASRRVLEKCGFEMEGRFKNAVVKCGNVCDEIRYAKLKERID